MDYNVAVESPLRTAALQRLNALVEKGKLGATEMFKAIRESSITPYRVYTRDMFFDPGTPGCPPRYGFNLDTTKLHYRLHRHALGQMAGEVKIPIAFVNTLMNGEDWENRQLADLLEERFNRLDFKQRGGGSPRFLNLVVRDEVRGFVSRSFRRYLRSGPIFEAFCKTAAQFQALPVETIVTDLSFTLRCMLPYAFEADTGLFLAFGLSCSNSDFGAGPFRIALTALNLNNGVITVLKHVREDRHGGAAEKDAGQSEELSDETISKKIAALQSEIRDVVTAAFHPDKINDLLQLIRTSMQKRITWARFQSYLQGKLTSEEIRELETLLHDKQKSQALADINYDVDDNALLTLWWASNAVADIAKRYNDEKRDELQTAAGQLILRDAA